MFLEAKLTILNLFLFFYHIKNQLVVIIIDLFELLDIKIYILKAIHYIFRCHLHINNLNT